MPNMPTDLPENDRALVEAAKAGDEWTPTGENKNVRATTIRALCLGLWDGVVVDPKGVNVTGAHIVGGLDLSFGTARGPLSLQHCHFDERLVIEEARLPALRLSGSRLAKGLSGDGARIDGNLNCNHDFHSIGEVRLLGAQIGGAASFVGATLDGKDGTALSADSMVVKGSLFCCGGFLSKGAVHLRGAWIGGSVYFTAGTLDGKNGRALGADRMMVKGSLFCRGGFHSIGEVRLLDSQIGGTASFAGATLDGKNGAALSADSMVVMGSLLCREGFRSIGEVRLLGAQIGGNADFEGANLDGGAGQALTADRLVVTGGLLCRKDFRLSGEAHLTAARIVGLLDWRPAEWSGRLNLSHATASIWGDNWGEVGWASNGTPTIDIDHFTYGAFFFGNNMKADSATRIAWIQAAQGDNFTPGPYQTLTRVLRAAGDDRGATAVGLAKARARVRHRAKEYSCPVKWLYQLWMGILDFSIGHGYRPWQGVIGLMILLVVGCAAFGLNAPQPHGGPGLIKPADPVFVTENKMRKLGLPAPTNHNIKYDDLPPEYTPFNAFWYSFDTLIPLIDLGQEKAWSPSPLTPEIARDKAGWALLFYLYFHIIMGWVLTTLTVVALTGLIKRDKDEE